MSVLGLDSGYTVKYNPSGKGLYLTVYPSSGPNTDTINGSVYLFRQSSYFGKIFEISEGGQRGQRMQDSYREDRKYFISKWGTHNT